MDRAVTESAAEAWLRCAPYLEGALRRSEGGFTLEDVKARIETGRAWFWPGSNAAAVYELTLDANAWLAGGSLAEIMERHADAEAWARGVGAERMTCRGRLGWARALEPLGYRPLTYLVKEL